MDMTASELKRKLERLGCSVEDGTKHWIVYYHGHRTTVPRHPGQGDQNPDLLRHPQGTGDQGKVSLHMEYAALFEPAEEGGFVITIPDFGWGFSQGETEVEARQMAAALLQTLVQEHIRKRETLPRPSKRRGSQYRFVRLSALQGAKAELYMAFLASRMRKAELARRLGIPKTNVDRLFDLDNHSRLDQIEAAFAALGKRIVLEVQDAA